MKVMSDQLSQPVFKALPPAIGVGQIIRIGTDVEVTRS